MQIGEEDLAFAQLGPFGRLRFLDLHDHVAGCENLGGGAGDDGSGLAIDLIARADTCTRVGLDDHAMTVSHIFANRAGCQADAIFVDFDLLWHTDAHRCTLPHSIRQSRPELKEHSDLNPCAIGALIQLIVGNLPNFQPLRSNQNKCRSITSIPPSCRSSRSTPAPAKSNLPSASGFPP